MTKRLLLIGTSGYAKEIAQIARRINPNRARWEEISYVGVSPAEIGATLLFGRVDYCDEDILSGAVTADAAIALGEPHLRQRVAAQYAAVPGLTYPNLIDPSVDYDPSLITMGTGNVIHRNVVMTFNIAMANFNFFNNAPSSAMIQRSDRSTRSTLPRPSSAMFRWAMVASSAPARG